MEGGFCLKDAKTAFLVKFYNFTPVAWAQCTRILCIVSC